MSDTTVIDPQRLVEAGGEVQSGAEAPAAVKRGRGRPRKTVSTAANKSQVRECLAAEL